MRHAPSPYGVPTVKSPSFPSARRKRCRAGEAVPDRRTSLGARDGLRSLLLKKSDMQTRRGSRAVRSFILWLAAPAASTAAAKGEHPPESSNPATTSPSCLLPSLPHLLQPLRHDARASAMIYMMSCTRGPVTECTLHANLAGLRVLRTAGVSRLQSGQRSWEDAWEQWDTVVQQ